MKKTLPYLLAIFFLAFSLFNCKNPFFPATGLPKGTGSYNRTIEGFTKQIMSVYENKDLTAFKNLIYDTSTFRFYVEHNMYKAANIHNINNTTFLDMDGIPLGKYWYLEYSQEYIVHDKLFNHNNEIVFTEPLAILNTEYPGLNDSATTDTLEAIIYATEAKISITANKFFQIFGDYTNEFKISEQRFYLKKDTVDNLWKIDKWFELNE